MQKLTVGSTDWGLPLNSYRAAVTGRASIPACLKHGAGVSALGGQEAPPTHLLLRVVLKISLDRFSVCFRGHLHFAPKRDLKMARR